jgi:hypothetical protein
MTLLPALSLPPGNSAIWSKFYNPIGGSLSHPRTEKKNPLRPKYVTYIGNKVSGFLTVRKIPESSLFDVDATKYMRDGSVFINKRLTEQELALLADDPTRDTNGRPFNQEYLNQFGAQCGYPCRFLRNGPQVIFCNPGTGRLGEAVFCFEIKDFFTKEMMRMLRFGRVDRVSASE